MENLYQNNCVNGCYGLDSFRLAIVLFYIIVLSLLLQVKNTKGDMLHCLIEHHSTSVEGSDWFAFNWRPVLKLTDCSHEAMVSEY